MPNEREMLDLLRRTRDRLLSLLGRDKTEQIRTVIALIITVIMLWVAIGAFSRVTAFVAETCQTRHCEGVYRNAKVLFYMAVAAGIAVPILLHRFFWSGPRK